MARFSSDEAPRGTGSAPPTDRIYGFYGRVATIYEFARHLHARVEVKDVFAMVAMHAGRVMSFDRLDIVVRDDSRGDYTVHNLYAEPRPDPARTSPAGPTERVLSTGDPVLQGELERVPYPWARHLRSALLVPLMDDHQVMGTLEFYANTGQAYDRDDLEIAGTLALPIATAVRNAFLYTRERRRTHTMQALQRVAAAATTTLDRDFLLEEACRQISREFGYYKVNLATVDDTHVRIAPRHRLFRGRKLPADQPPDEIPRSLRSLMTSAINEQRTIHAPDVLGDPRYFPEPGTRTRSEVAIPIVWRGVIHGLLDVQSEQSNAFSEEDIQMLVVLANQLAAGLENCRLYEQVNALLESYVPASVTRRMRAGSDRPVAGGERQQLSVLFADLRGFTSFAESHDAAHLVRTLNTYLEVATDAITRFGGTLDKFMGDAVMALFNAPEPQPDHAVRAVRAAMHMQQRMAQLQHTNTDGLQFGIGVNTGEAVVGNIGANTALNYTAIGDAVNVAKRLEERAAGSQVLISADTYELVKAHVQATPLGPLDLHNRRGPVHAYRLGES